MTSPSCFITALSRGRNGWIVFHYDLHVAATPPHSLYLLLELIQVFEWRSCACIYLLLDSVLKVVVERWHICQVGWPADFYHTSSPQLLLEQVLCCTRGVGACSLVHIIGSCWLGSVVCKLVTSGVWDGLLSMSLSPSIGEIWWRMATWFLSRTLLQTPSAWRLKINDFMQKNKGFWMAFKIVQ